MTNHLRRIQEHMAVEAEALLTEAKRARLFDHKGNRGTEAEHSILRWLRARLGPEYSICSGEIIDSFGTNADVPSRQQDGIVYRNCAEANRFLLPSGMRLVPIETVAAVVEVKLSLSSQEFENADRAAIETSRLRLRGQMGSMIPTEMRLGSTRYRGVATDDYSVAIDDPAYSAARPTFAVFGFNGPSEIETLANWLREAKSVTLAACLESGCALRAAGNLSYVSSRDSALVRFGECLSGATDRHARVWKDFKPSFSEYLQADTVGYSDATGFDPEPGYDPTPAEVERLKRFRANQARKK